MARYSIAMLTVLAGGGLVLGCASESRPPPSTPAAVSGAEYAGETLVPATPPPAQPALPRADTATPTSGSIHIDPKIQEACGNLPELHFAFDSAAIEEGAKTSLEALIQCFTTGPLKGREVRLEGYADPRGTAEYNYELGERRASSVADFLTQHGVAKAHLETLSKGEAEAQGTDEAGWARDRKVVIMLVE